jgi:hypothetical protein
MSQTSIPGTCAKHAIISDDCRIGRTEVGAFNEAVARLFEEYGYLCQAWPIQSGAKFHLVLTVEKPQNDVLPR